VTMNPDRQRETAVAVAPAGSSVASSNGQYEYE
jgi:hypothetical protein